MSKSIFEYVKNEHGNRIGVMVGLLRENGTWNAAITTYDHYTQKRSAFKTARAYAQGFNADWANSIEYPPFKKFLERCRRYFKGKEQA